MLDDLDDLIAQQGQDRKDLVEIREQLVGQILTLARSFSHKRNQLIAWGRRPSWTSKEEMEARPGYGEGYGPEGDFGRKRQLASTVRRWIAKIFPGPDR